MLRNNIYHKLAMTTKDMSLFLESDSSLLEGAGLKRDDTAPKSAKDSSEKEIAEGRWEEQDNLRFTVFIEYHQEVFLSRHQRKSLKIFKMLSDYLGNRTAAQCRSHYQKLMLKHKSIAKLKRYYKNSVGMKIYDEEIKNLASYSEENGHPAPSPNLLQKERKEIAIQTETICCHREVVQEERDREGLSNNQPLSSSEEVYESPTFISYSPFAAHDWALWFNQMSYMGLMQHSY